MSLTFYAPVIFVKNIQISKKFYVELLGQEIEHDFGKNIVFKSRISLWEIVAQHEIEQIKGNSLQGNTFELYFETDDIEELLSRMKMKGVSLLHDIKTEPWGQMTFRFFDPDHHLVEIGESLPTFVNRIYNEGGSVGSVVKQTGIAEELVRKIVNK
jgi:catechol 2,3-dioxygenase-like lactoylglutathione lyase family enzyme